MGPDVRGFYSYESRCSGLISANITAQNEWTGRSKWPSTAPLPTLGRSPSHPSRKHRIYSSSRFSGRFSKCATRKERNLRNRPSTEEYRLWMESG